MTRTTILIAHQSYLVRQGLRFLLLELEHVEVVQNTSGDEDICELTNRVKPDILIVSPDMLPSDADLRKLFPETLGLSLIFISSGNKPKAGALADGHIDYRDGPDVIMEQVKRVIHKKTQSPSVSEKPTDTLSAREKNILRHVALGQTNKEIADRLFISVHTVVTHRKNIIHKLGIKSVSGLTVYAILNNLVSIDEVK